jgi:hypothetical protein
MCPAVVGGAAGGRFINTKPDRSKCRTSRAAVILAIAVSASWTRLLPSKQSANDKVWAISSGVAGRRWGSSGMPGP